MKKQWKHINLSRLTAFILSVAMLAGFCPQGVSFADIPITVSKVNAAENISNPIIVKDSSMDAGQKVTWACVYFGSYPQSEVTSKDGSIYNALKNATGWDENNDITIGGTKYRRLKGEDATYYSSNEEGQYDWNGNYKTYHYFKYEPIKWRVLNRNGNDALLLADVALDDQKYNINWGDVTWETSSIRSWLNGYGASVNQPGTDYSKKNFINSAFTSTQKNAIKTTSVVNNNNITYGTAGGNNTSDKVFLLSESEVYNTDTAAGYGFVKDYNTYDEARRSRCSTYAYAMGTWRNHDTYAEYTKYNGNIWWWLRSPGHYSYYAAQVYNIGWVYRGGDNVDYYDDAVRPALHLNLSSTNLYSYAGTVCSDAMKNGESGTDKTENDFVKQLDVENLLDDINIGGEKLSSPTMNILGKKVSLLNMDADVKLSVSDSIQAVYNQKNRTVEVLIGFKQMDDSATIGQDGNTTTYWSQSYQQVKNLYQNATGKKVNTTKLWNQYSKLRGKLKKQNASLGIKASASVMGYLEFSCGSGKPVFSKGGIVTELKTGADYTFHWAPPFSAVYTRIGVGVNSEGNLKVKYNEAKKYVFSGDLGVDGSLEGAIGIGSKRGGTYAEGTLTGTLNSKLKFPASSLEKCLKVTGNLTAKINVAVLNYDLTENNLKHDFGNYQFYPAQSKAKIQKIEKNANSIISDGDLTLTHRSYLEDEGVAAQAEQGQTFEKKNCFPSNAPQLLSLSDDKKLLIWNDDNPKKDDKNNVSIYYCIYDGTSWGEIKQIEDDGCLCGSVSTVERDGKVNIIFSRSNEPILKNETLDDTLQKMDLYIAKFDGETFSVPDKLITSDGETRDSNSIYEVMYGVGIQNDKLHYAWVENSENSYFLSEGTNKIYWMSDDDSKELITSTANTVSDFTVSKTNGYVAWKETNSDETEGKIYIANGTDKKQLLTDEDISNFKIVDNKLFATKEGGICCWDLETGNEEGECSLNLSDYEVEKSGDDYVIVYCQTEADGTQTLWMVKGTGFEWTESVQIAKDNAYLRNASISVDEEGNVMAARNLLDVTEDGVQFNKGTLKVDVLNSYADFVCGDYLVYNSDEIIPSGKADFTFEVLNNSQEKIESFDAVMKDKKGNVFYSGSVDQEISPGERAECTVQCNIPSNLEKTDVTLTVTPPYHEYDTTNNSCSTTCGYADIKITNMEQKDEREVAVTFENNGYESVTDSTLEFYLDSEENTPIYSCKGPVVPIGKTITESYTIPEQALAKSEGKASLICVVTPKEEEEETANNTGYLEFTWSNSNPIIPDEPKKDEGKNNNPSVNQNNKANEKVAVSSIRLSGISKQIAAGKKLTLKATVLPDNASNKKLIWKSSNPKIATVTQRGIVTLKKKTGGKKVTITATATDGSKKYASWKLTSMKGIVKKVKITGSKPVKAGKKLKLKAKVNATKKANKKLLWTSGNTKYATVNAKGIVTTKKSAKGKTVKITAMATDGSGKKNTVKIKIK